jgi:hypothetical protein
MVINTIKAYTALLILFGLFRKPFIKSNGSAAKPIPPNITNKNIPKKVNIEIIYNTKLTWISKICPTCCEHYKFVNSEKKREKNYPVTTVHYGIADVYRNQRRNQFGNWDFSSPNSNPKNNS